jgi:hypothetical protein
MKRSNKARIRNRQFRSTTLHKDLQHYPQSPLVWASDDGWLPESQVLLAPRPAPADAIVFVHGWGGNAGDTWETFPQAVCMLPEAGNADIFFLDYPSVRSQVPFCSAQLRRFLVDLVRNPSTSIVNGSLPRNALKRAHSARYERICIVAHSMGAAISRRALMDLDQRTADGLTDKELAAFRLLFFAPAHSGSSIPLLIGSGLGINFLPGAKAVGALLRLWLQSLRDLEEGSPFLTELLQSCQRLRAERTHSGRSIVHLRATVYHAHNDRVVSQNNFDQDPPFHPVMNQTHRSICKPNKTYHSPLEALRALLAV